MCCAGSSAQCDINGPNCCSDQVTGSLLQCTRQVDHLLCKISGWQLSKQAVPSNVSTTAMHHTQQQTR